MGSFIRTILILILASFTTAEASDVFSLYGLEFPSMKNESWVSDSITKFTIMERKDYRIYFHISDSGKVDSITTDYAEPPNDLARLITLLSKIEFYTARLNGTRIPFVIPARLTLEIKNRRFSADLQMPFDEINCTINRGLVEESFRLNNINLPRLDRFPSYHIVERDKADIKDYPYIVYNVTIDSTGKLINYEPVASFGVDYSDRIDTKFLYAEYSPLKINGQGVKSSFYLIFRFFNMVFYPVDAWPPTDTSEAVDPLDLQRLEYFYYRDTVLNPPIPINTPGGYFTAGELMLVADTISVNVKIDSSGNVTRFKLNKRMLSPVKERIEEVIPKLKFTPARNWNGEKIVFQGEIEVVLNNSKYIRISPLWLPGRDNSAQLNTRGRFK